MMDEEESPGVILGINFGKIDRESYEAQMEDEKKW
jgi:hypothetical protein